MARVKGTLTGTSFASGGKVSLGLLALGGQPAADATATPTAYTLTASPGTFSVTGTAAATPVARKLMVSPGSVAISGFAVTLPVGRKLIASAGSFTIMGSAATLTRGRYFTASAGSLSIAGSPLTPVVARIILASPGSFTLIGDQVTLVGPGPPPVVTPAGVDDGIWYMHAQQLQANQPAREKKPLVPAFNLVVDEDQWDEDELEALMALDVL